MGSIYIAECDGSGIVELLINKLNELAGTDVVVLGNGTSEVSVTVAEFYVQLFRRYRLHRNEREAVWSSADQLITTQLVTAEQNKLSRGEFDVDSWQVVQHLSALLEAKLSKLADDSDPIENSNNELSTIMSKYQSFLCECNAVDIADVFTTVTSACQDSTELAALITGTSFLIVNPKFHCHVELLPLDQFRSVLQRCLVRHLAAGKPTHHVSVSLPLDESFGSCLMPSRADVNVDACQLEDIIRQRCTVSDGNTHVISSTLSATERYVEQVMLGYLRLLVNSRDELALARIINVPHRGLDHTAFTDVKHEAKRRGLSMYQTVTSFVMRIRLGGRGYAPAADYSLMKHCKGLSEFTDLMMKLHTIIEDDSNVESSIRRVTSILKGCIMKCGEVKLRKSSIESVTERLCNEALSSMSADRHVLGAFTSPPRPVSAGGSNAGRHAVRILRSLLDHHAAMPLPVDSSDMLHDSMSSQRTPIRFASLLSVFRSPEEVAEEEKRLKQKTTKTAPAKQAIAPHQSCLDWAPVSSFVPRTIVDYVPSKTIVHLAARRVLESIGDQENIPVDSATKPDLASSSDLMKPSSVVTGKRLGNAASNNAPAKKAKMLKTVAPKPKLIPLQKGQKKLSSFFRM